jgi:hypothetical protein
MKRVHLIQPFLVLCLFVFLPHAVHAAVVLRVSSTPVLQGDPLLLTLDGISTTTPIRSITFNAQPVQPFVYARTVVALIGIPLTIATGSYPVRVIMKDGTSLETLVTVARRIQPPLPLGIPVSLGGTNKKSAATLVSKLQKDNTSLLDMKTSSTLLWSAPFVFPVAQPIVTDSYGYVRQTVGYTIAHKGTDFRAGIGTKVFAMNRGIIRIAQKSATYGNMIVIDHGLGLFTMYMHLSKIAVKKDSSSKRGVKSDSVVILATPKDHICMYRCASAMSRSIR